MDFFGQSVTIKVLQGEKSTTQLEAAMDAERAASRGYEDGLGKIAKAAQGNATPEQSHAMKRLKHQVVISQWYADAYRAIKASADANRPWVWGMRVFDPPTGKRVRAHIRDKMPDLFRYTGAVWLDGTANEGVWVACLGNSPIVPFTMRLNVKPGPYILTQFPDKPYGRTFWNSRVNLDRLHRFVLYQAQRKRTVLLVTQEKVERNLRHLGLPDNVATRHFNATRGSNEFKDYDCAIVVGRAAVSPDELELMTEGLYHDNPEVTEMLTAGGRYMQTRRQLAVADYVDPLTGTKTARGSISVPAESHPDPRCEALRQQISDAEPRQAMHRLRLYDRHLLTMPEVFVFGTADMELPIKHVRQWKDADVPAAAIVVASGIVPQSADLLGRLFNGAFSNWSGRSLDTLAAQCKLQLQNEFPQQALYKNKRESSSLLKHIAEIRVAEDTEEGAPDYSDWRRFLVKFAGVKGYHRKIDVDTGRYTDAKGAIERAIRHAVSSISELNCSDDNGDAGLAP